MKIYLNKLQSKDTSIQSGDNSWFDMGFFVVHCM